MPSYNAIFDAKESTMRTTVTLDDDLVKEAKRLTGKDKVSELVNEGLRVLVRSEKAKRLIALGGSEPNAETPPRRRYKF
jgi:Arc/MetJ family transcription regulator